MEGEFEAEDREEQESFKSCLTVVEVVADKDGTETLYSPEHEKYSNQLVEELPAKVTDADTTSQAEDEGLLPAIAKLQRSHRTSAPREKDPEDEVSITSIRQRLPHKKVSELILKKLAASVFQQQQTESFNDSTTCKDMPMNDSHECIGNMNSCLEGQYVNDEYFGEESFFSSIPEDFICPFTGELFEEPVTLETGQAFDRTAIKEWFDQGHKTCPVIGQTLKCHALPTTSFVLKRAIDHWKSEHRRNLQASACQIEGNQSAHEIRSKDERAILVLEQLLFCSTAEDRCASVKQLISLGGLQYLTQ
ncbi:putative E3 ubiquitin-protein ligase LIN [Papaver somniferum]|uniref:putative E3 ubiquitin-protein ligase LIN n=1 Tax=Papaver somniferum TaxID=3469 RepID=UPI000E6FA60B|nr:putative E3 ubiquitin-protein ligase LIN [Papaver somniferum]